MIYGVAIVAVVNECVGFVSGELTDVGVVVDDTAAWIAPPCIFEDECVWLGAGYFSYEEHTVVAECVSESGGDLRNVVDTVAGIIEVVEIIFVVDVSGDSGDSGFVIFCGYVDCVGW